MVSTLDFESSDPSSNLGGTWLTPWRNGSASDSRSEGCVFESRRGQHCFEVFNPASRFHRPKVFCASNEDWTHDLWFTRPTLCHWAIEAYVYTWGKLCLQRRSVPWHKNVQGTHGFEPWTYRTAADCSTTELYPHLFWLPCLIVHVWSTGQGKQVRKKWESKWESNIGVARDL